MPRRSTLERRLSTFDCAGRLGLSTINFQLSTDLHSSGSGGGGVVYWRVGDAQAALTRLLSLGAKERSAIQDVGDGIKVATAFDPFGNVFGIIQNPLFIAEGMTSDVALRQDHFAWTSAVEARWRGGW